MKNICYLCSAKISVKCFGSTKKLATFALHTKTTFVYSHYGWGT